MTFEEASYQLQKGLNIHGDIIERSDIRRDCISGNICTGCIHCNICSIYALSEDNPPKKIYKCKFFSADTWSKDGEFEAVNSKFKDCCDLYTEAYDAFGIVLEDLIEDASGKYAGPTSICYKCSNQEKCRAYRNSNVFKSIVECNYFKW